MLSLPRWWPPRLLVVMRQFKKKKKIFVCLIAKVNCRLRQLRNGRGALPCFPRNGHIPPRLQKQDEASLWNNPQTIFFYSSQKDVLSYSFDRRAYMQKVYANSKLKCEIMNSEAEKEALRDLTGPRDRCE